MTAPSIGCKSGWASATYTAAEDTPYQHDELSRSRPVHLQPLSNEVLAIPPKERVYGLRPPPENVTFRVFALVRNLLFRNGRFWRKGPFIPQIEHLTS